MASLSSTSLDLTIYDALTSKRFHGNPAAVVVHSAPLEEALYKEIAREFNQPMTAFVIPLDSPDVAPSDSRFFRLHGSQRRWQRLQYAVTLL
jgi:predicted PhzF superfamily epimerase YddE/YHI9